MSDIGNPPAFPHHPGYASGSEGMTLRDYFAAAALPRCIEVAAQFVMDEPDFKPDTRNLSEIMRRAAGFATFAADALIKELEK